MCRLISQLTISGRISKAGQGALSKIGWCQEFGPSQYIRIMKGETPREKVIAVAQKAISNIGERNKKAQPDKIAVKTTKELPPTSELNKLLDGCL